MLWHGAQKTALAAGGALAFFAILFLLLYFALACSYLERKDSRHASSERQQERGRESRALG